MANGLTFLPAFGQQEANTEVLPESNQVLNTYLALSEKRYKDKVFDYQKNEADIKRKLDALDFDVSEVWQPDVEPIRNEMIAYRDFVFENPDSVNPDNAMFGEQKKMADDLNFKINISKYDKANDTEYRKLMTTQPEFATPENEQRLTSHKETKLGERNFQGFKMPFEDNPFEYMDKYKAAIKEGDATVDMKNAGYGYVNQTTNTPYHLDEEMFNAIASADYNSSWKKKKVAEELFAALPEDQRRSQGINSPFDAFKAQRRGFLDLTAKKDSKLERINYAPTGGSTKEVKVTPYLLGVGAQGNTGSPTVGKQNYEYSQHIGAWPIEAVDITVSSPPEIYNMNTGQKGKAQTGYVSGKVMKISDDYVYKKDNSAKKQEGMILPANSDNLSKAKKNGDVEQKRFVTMVVNDGDGNLEEVRFLLNDEVATQLAEKGVKLGAPPTETTESGIQWK